MYKGNIVLFIAMTSCFIKIGSCFQCEFVDNGTHAICTNSEGNPDNPKFWKTTGVANLTMRGPMIQNLQKSTSLSAFNTVKHVSFGNLGIEELSRGVFDHMENLETLVLMSNKIKQIPDGLFNKLERLKDLDLSRNLLTNITSDSFSNLKSLEYLELSNNLIRYIDNNAFSDLVSLKILELTNNNINIIQDNLLQNLISLERLFVSNNPLSVLEKVSFNNRFNTLIAYNTTLEHFHLNLSHLTMSSIDLSDGNLEQFHFENLGPVTHLINLSNNHLRLLENFNSVETNRLLLENNSLTEIPEISPKVDELSLSHNAILFVEQISNLSNYKLRILNLSFNNIDSATCLQLPLLEHLDLSNNRISVISIDSFNGCSNLKRIFLSSNQIKKVDFRAFQNLESLSSLDINNNKITENDCHKLVNIYKFKIFCNRLALN